MTNVDIVHLTTSVDGSKWQTYKPIATAHMSTEQLQLTQQTITWFNQNDWTLFDFQKQAWQAWHDGESGLIHSPTGSGKTLAAWLGPVQAAAAQATIANTLAEDPSAERNQHVGTGLKVLWITPLRALAGDTRENLVQACKAHGLKLDVQIRTGDTTAAPQAARTASVCTNHHTGEFVPAVKLR